MTSAVRIPPRIRGCLAKPFAAAGALCQLRRFYWCRLSKHGRDREKKSGIPLSRSEFE